MVCGVPFVDSKVVVTCDGCDRGIGNGRVGVSGDVNDRGVGQELHDHTHIILDCRKHHRSLQCNSFMTVKLFYYNKIFSSDKKLRLLIDKFNHVHA